MKPRWSPAGSTVLYTPAEVQSLTPIRRSVETRPPAPERRDVFLCHAWDDRGGAAKELHDLLESRGVSVWFSEKDVLLGSPEVVSWNSHSDLGVQVRLMVKTRPGQHWLVSRVLRRLALEELQAEGLRPAGR